MSVETASSENEVDVKKEQDAKDEEEQDEKKEAEPKKEEPKKPKKKKYENWPLRDVKEPHDHDVLYGRGGGTNHHPGNKRYRKMVEERKMDYVNSKRLDKPLVALEIIRQWRDQDPPGRFLKLDEKAGVWHDVGDRKAREKTSQALREKAPMLRKQQEEEQHGGSSGSDEDATKPETTTSTKTTRFAEGTSAKKSNPVKKAVLARDHSLGREYIEAGEEVTLEGFSWQDPLDQVYPEGGGRTSSQGSTSRPPSAPAEQPYYPPGRMNSYGSVGVAHPNYHQSHGSYGPPEYRVMSGERHSQYASSGRYESWGQPVSSMGSAGPPPMPPPPRYGDPYAHHHSGSWGPPPPHGPHGPPPPPPMGREGPPPMGREHSLSGNQLRDASISHPAVGFNSGRSGSGSYWPEVPPVPQRGGGGSYAPPPPQERYSSRTSPPRRTPPPYSVDPAIAQTWSSQSDEHDRVSSGMMAPEVPRTWSGEEYERKHRPRHGDRKHAYGGERAEPNRKHSPKRREMEEQQRDHLPRPHTVKRATSHQNENVETKKDLKGPSVKRAALNRDNSLASNRLKEKYLKGRDFDTEKEMRHLSGTLEQATLETAGAATKTRPKHLSESDRLSTVDKIAMDLMTQPEPLGLGRSRSSTIEALALDFDSDSMLRPDFERQPSAKDSLFGSEKDAIPKPDVLNSDGRLTTMDFLDMVNEPLGSDDGAARPLELNRDVSVSEWLNDV